MTADASERGRQTVAEWLRHRMPHSSVLAGACETVAVVRVGLGLFHGEVSQRERHDVLHAWFSAFHRAFLIPPDEPAWRRVTESDMSNRNLNLNEGGWVLLFRADGDQLPTPLADLPGRTHADMDRLRLDMHGAVYLIAWEDDIEWTVSADAGSLAKMA